MSASNKIVARILIGSAIGGLLGLILLIMGIAVVLNGFGGKSSRNSEGLEVEVHDADPNREAERPWGSLPSDEGRAGYDDRYDPDHDPYEARRYGDDGDWNRDDYRYDDEDGVRRWDSNPYGEHDRERDYRDRDYRDRDHRDREYRERDYRDRDDDRRERDEDARSNRGGYPHLEAPPPAVTVPRRTEPLPEASRSQWRSIFEDEAPRPRTAPPAPSATSPAPRPEAAPQARPAPRPSTPREAPQAKKDEESLFY